jgi:O-acetylhomoserine (thiol)-lyase
VKEEVDVRDETIAIHAGYEDPSTRAVAVPIYQTVAHDFIDADHAGAVFDLEQPGFHYNRLNNPTNAVLEHRLAALEHGSEALTLGSGMAAVTTAILNCTGGSGNVVCAPQLYGASYTFFTQLIRQSGVEARLGADDRVDSLAPLIDGGTKAVFCESIGNPAGNVVDLEAIASMAHDAGVPLLVDNTVASPLYLKPVDHGADVVIHSLTKFIGGHGTALGGAIVDGGHFDWGRHADRFPMFSTPEPAFHGVVYAEQFPGTAYAVRCRTVGMRNFGPVLSPFNAFLFLQGLETLSVRLERHESNTRRIAAFLSEDPRVAWVSFVGFPDHPSYELAQRYLAGRVPSMLTFGLVGGYDGAIRFFNATGLFKRLVNLGDAKSLVSHPASTTHRQLGPSDLAVVGISPDMIRLSIGIEHVDDLLADLDQALGVASAG